MEVLTNVVSLENMIYLLGGAVLSIIIAFGAMLIGLVIGTILAAMRISRNKILNLVSMIYIEFIRGTPMLLQILFLSLGFPTLYRTIVGGRLDIDPIVVGIIAIGLNSAAYSAELIRSGINSIDKGQWEAAKTLGLNHSNTMRKIILPQAFRRIVPPLASELIMLVKDSSLVYAIGGLELLGRSKVLGARYYSFVTTLIMAAFIYLVITNVIGYFTRKLEKKLSVY